MPKQTNIRLPDSARSQLADLCELLDMTKVQVIILALDRLYRNAQLDRLAVRQRHLEPGFYNVLTDQQRAQL